MEKRSFQNDNYYHIYNRGVDKRNVFQDKKDFVRFLESIWAFNNIEPAGSLYDFKKSSIPPRSLRDLGGIEGGIENRLVKIICYCLNQNHYHFLIKQISDNGISKFIGRLSNGYTKYFNKRNNRSGSLFQGKFQYKEVKSDYYLVWLSAYINGNSEIHQIEKAKNWRWSSALDFLNKREGKLCSKKDVLFYFKQLGIGDNYAEFMNEVIKSSTKRKKDKKWEMKKYIIE